jgi:hypothetical protein
MYQEERARPKFAVLGLDWPLCLMTSNLNHGEASF